MAPRARGSGKDIAVHRDGFLTRARERPKFREPAIGVLDKIPSLAEVVTPAAVVADPQREPGRFDVHGHDFE
jgi:hypothetical protein